VQEGPHRERWRHRSRRWSTCARPGLAKADKKAGRVAAEGRIARRPGGGKAVLVEINSETDFVAKDENFLPSSDAVAQAALASGAPTSKP
jgi:elongation factor Ts